MYEESKQGVQLHQELEETGLPYLLGYTIAEDQSKGEIMMTNGGTNLLEWRAKISSKKTKMLFILAMIYQVVHGLEKLHSFGYAHSDLKLENICARVASDGKLKFTLIDFGVVSKLKKIGDVYVCNRKLFKGNLLTSSLEHIISHRSSIIDDIYSLLCVAYAFVFDKLPWEKRVERYLSSFKSGVSAEQLHEVYIKIRVKFAEVFNYELIENSQELGALFRLVIQAMQRKKKIEIKHRKLRKVSDTHHSINY